MMTGGDGMALNSWSEPWRMLWWWPVVAPSGGRVGLYVTTRDVWVFLSRPRSLRLSSLPWGFNSPLDLWLEELLWVASSCEMFLQVLYFLHKAPLLGANPAESQHLAIGDGILTVVGMAAVCLSVCLYVICWGQSTRMALWITQCGRQRQILQFMLLPCVCL